MEFHKKLEMWILAQFDNNISKAAKALDKYPRDIYNYINGTNAPGTPLLIKLREMGCDMNWLLEGENIPCDTPYEKLLTQISELTKENNMLKEQLKNQDKNLLGAVRDALEKYQTGDGPYPKNGD